MVNSILTLDIYKLYGHASQVKKHVGLFICSAHSGNIAYHSLFIYYCIRHVFFNYFYLEITYLWQWDILAYRIYFLGCLSSYKHNEHKYSKPLNLTLWWISPLHNNYRLLQLTTNVSLDLKRINMNKFQVHPIPALCKGELQIVQGHSWESVLSLST